jgi:hypothetical protein
LYPTKTSTCVKRLNERRWERRERGRDRPVMDGMRKNCQVISHFVFLFFFFPFLI